MLFNVRKLDAADKNKASYIVKANSAEDALTEVNLTSADVAELNQEYNFPFPRYSVSIEEINLEDRNFYLLD